MRSNKIFMTSSTLTKLQVTDTYTNGTQVISGACMMEVNSLLKEENQINRSRNVFAMRLKSNPQWWETYNINVTGNFT